MEKIRLAKYLATCGFFSRRKWEKIIQSGKIRISDKKITDLSFKVNENDRVDYDGIILNPEKKIIIALNKPTGYLSTVKDKFGRKTVLDLLKNFNSRMYPVGRLDYNSRGLLFIANDGDFAYKITHPKFQVPKIYEVLINKNISDNDLAKIAKGVIVEGKRVVPTKVKILKRRDDQSLIMVGIVEGRKRIIRKLFQVLRYKVIDLKRVQIGNYRLGKLKEGSFKILKNSEIANLMNYYN
jgi:23S rRNA pseudouridine2605 synthase